MKSVGLCFFGLSTKDLAVFDRVIGFVEKKGHKFHKSSAESAAILIVNDDPDAMASALQQQKSHVIISISDNDDCIIGDYKIKRPLLITRVMRALEQAGEEKNTSPTNEDVAGSTQPTTDSLPIKKKVAVKQKTKIKSPKKVAAMSTERGDFHALVVDDSAAIRKQLELELRDTPISADYANCGKDALEKINKTQYDLIFLDIIMPDIYGYEVCKALRKKENYKRTPVIMLSGKTEPLDEVEGIIAGATTYLLKPVKHKDFQKTLKRISKWLYHYA
ncbi:MAG: response regulator [Cocleimonas sp.]|nr:response regulator [Cocleimonas sp.]